MEVDSATFRQILGHVPTGVTVVTANAPHGPVGLAIGAFFSVSLEPPLVGVCASTESRSWSAVRAAASFCVNVLADDEEHLSRVFATTGADKFAGLDWTTGPTGAPRLAGVLAWIDCDIVEIHPAGDHDVCIAAVREMELVRDAGPLVFHRGGYRSIGR